MSEKICAKCKTPAGYAPGIGYFCPSMGCPNADGPMLDAPAVAQVNEQEWFSPKHKLPPEGVVVDALNSAGQMTQLKLRKGLWWFADDSMYVYYVPTFWRLIR